MEGLLRKKCAPCEGGVAVLAEPQIDALLKGVVGWRRAGTGIEKVYPFRDYHETMAFVNATAWVSHREGHHPDIVLGFNSCRVTYTTHAIGGLSENDFICAAKIDSLLDM